ncbi:hypothetical protein BMS3Bbin04_00801 [bacterium BMS3Bbin04]|nr:hypothetical protein BMS3Bbin04_00801 [bacterium BMS3Bbin04]
MQYLIRVSSLQNFEGDAPGVFISLGADTLNVINSGYCELNRLHDSFFHFGRGSAGVNHRDVDHVEIEFREHFLLQVGHGEETTDQQDKHQDVRSDMVGCHVG